MADRIVVMNAGRIEQIGSPLELYDPPANLFVADFIGSPSMNFVHAVLRTGDGNSWVALEDCTQLPVPTSYAPHAGKKVVFGIRPEHTQYATSDDGVALTVEVVEPTRANIQVFANLGGAHFCALFTSSATGRKRSPASVRVIGWLARLKSCVPTHCPRGSGNLQASGFPFRSSFLDC